MADLTTIAHTLTSVLATADADAATAAVKAGSVPIGAGIAAGLAVLGVGIGVGKLATAALEGSARQPEMAGKLQGMMILAIAFIEALALVALLVFPNLL